MDRSTWEKMKQVLEGKLVEEVGLSQNAACIYAGIEHKEALKWVRISEEKRLQDEPWVHEISPIWHSVDQVKARDLSDELWHRARFGIKELLLDPDHNPIKTRTGEQLYKVKYDNALAIRVMEKLDPTWRRDVKVKPPAESDDKNLSLDEQWNRIKRIRDARIANATEELKEKGNHFDS